MADFPGALVSHSSNIVTVADVCAVGMTRTRNKGHQPGSADGLQTQFPRGILALSALHRKALLRPRGSSRNSVTAASQTTVRASQSIRQTPSSSETKFCPGYVRVVDRGGLAHSTISSSNTVTTNRRDNLSSRNRDVLPLNGVGSLNRMSRKNQGRRSLKDCRKRGTFTPSFGLQSTVNGILCSRMEVESNASESSKSS